MKHIVVQLFFFFLIVLCCCEKTLSKPGKTETPPSAGDSRVLYEAKQMLSNLESTRYSHEIKVNEKSGLYILDCSALASYLLSRAEPDSLRSVPVDPDLNRPLARDFHTVFMDTPVERPRNGWLRIIRLEDAEPGDFIVWRRMPRDSNGNTGHIVIVMEKPVIEKDVHARVTVLDASQNRHAQDSRKKGDNGVGTGVMWFEIDKKGAPVALYWSDPKRKPEAYPIAIGRATGIPGRDSQP